ncbi:MAG: sugar phosphate isomerase/epimerase family protein [Phycisphaerales bacterium JB039]
MGQIGACSWSIRAQGPRELAAGARACGVAGVQIALDPIREGACDAGETAARLADSGIAMLSGMMATRGEDYSTLDSIRRTGGLRPDAHWAANQEAARRNADIAARLGLKLVTLHAGFLPEDPADPERATLLNRLVQVARIFESRGVTLGLETGQETAETLLRALAAPGLERVGVNFDPANMILYGMGDPTESLRALAARVVQMHIKDAVPAEQSGEWGTEVPAGQGAVNWPALFDVLGEAKLDVDLVIEREAGEDRITDITTARRLVESLGRGAGA